MPVPAYSFAPYTASAGTCVSPAISGLPLFEAAQPAPSSQFVPAFVVYFTLKPEVRSPQSWPSLPEARAEVDTASPDTRSCTDACTVTPAFRPIHWFSLTQPSVEFFTRKPEMDGEERSVTKLETEEYWPVTPAPCANTRQYQVAESASVCVDSSIEPLAVKAEVLPITTGVESNTSTLKKSLLLSICTV